MHHQPEGAAPCDLGHQDGTEYLHMFNSLGFVLTPLAVYQHVVPSNFLPAHPTNLDIIELVLDHVG